MRQAAPSCSSFTRFACQVKDAHWKRNAALRGQQQVDCETYSTHFASSPGWGAEAWLASWLFSWLTGVPLTNLNWALNFIGIAIFVGLTAWDTNQLKKIGQQTDGGVGLVVIGALKLYLDYINLFLLLLRASNR